MWLPRDERYLLIVYYVCMPELRVEAEAFSSGELERFFMKKRLRVPFVGPKMIARLARLLRKQRKETAQSQEVESSQNQNKSQNQYGEYLKIKQRIETSNNLLQERELIEVKEGGTGIYEIKMKLKGIDLGRKYKSWLIPSGLWFAEYKDHWFWLILGFLGGIIGALLVN